MATIIAVLQSIPMLLNLANKIWAWFESMTQEMTVAERKKWLQDAASVFAKMQQKGTSVEDKKAILVDLDKLFKRL